MNSKSNQIKLSQLPTSRTLFFTEWIGTSIIQTFLFKLPQYNTQSTFSTQWNNVYTGTMTSTNSSMNGWSYNTKDYGDISISPTSSSITASIPIYVNQIILQGIITANSSDTLDGQNLSAPYTATLTNVRLILTLVLQYSCTGATVIISDISIEKSGLIYSKQDTINTSDIGNQCMLSVTGSVCDTEAGFAICTKICNHMHDAIATNCNSLCDQLSGSFIETTLLNAKDAKNYFSLPLTVPNVITCTDLQHPLCAGEFCGGNCCKNQLNFSDPGTCCVSGACCNPVLATGKAFCSPSFIC